jgi:hypothetical protein
MLVGLDRFFQNPITALVGMAVLAALGLIALSGRYMSAGYVIMALAWVIAAIGLRELPFPVLASVMAIFGGAFGLASYYLTPAPKPENIGKIDVVLDTRKASAARPLEIGDGGAIFLFGDTKAETALSFLRALNLKLEVIDGKIAVSAELKDQHGDLVAELVRNEWQVASKPQAWDRNYNSNTLEVKNSTGRIALQVRLLPDRVQLQGEWWSNGQGFRMVRSPSIPGGFIVVFGPNQPPEKPPFVVPLFKYPSDTHFGELVKP